MSNSTAFVGTQNVWQEWYELTTGLHGRLMADALIGLTTSTGLQQVIVTSGGNLHVELQPSTELIGLLGASTAIIGYIKIDQTTPGASNAITVTSTGGTVLLSTSSPGAVKAMASTEKIGALQLSTEVIGLLGASTAVIGHIIADASTVKIGALQPSTEVIGLLGASTAMIGHVINDASTEKIGALQLSTEIIGYVKIDQTTPGASNAVTVVSTGGAPLGMYDGRIVLTPNAGSVDGAYSNNSAPLTDINGTQRPLSVHAFLYDAGNALYDRSRNNHAITVLASAARTSDAVSGDQTNYNSLTQVLQFVCSSASTAGLTPSVQIKDSISASYMTVWSAAAAIITTGHYAYAFNMASTGSTGYTEAVATLLTRTWRLNVAHSSSGSATYSASIDYLVGG